MTNGTVVPVSDLANFIFDPVANTNGDDYATVDFRVRDDGGTANG